MLVRWIIPVLIQFLCFVRCRRWKERNVHNFRLTVLSMHHLKAYEAAVSFPVGCTLNLWLLVDVILKLTD